MLDITKHQAAIYSAPFAMPYAKQELGSDGFGAPLTVNQLSIPIGLIKDLTKTKDRFRSPEPVKQPYLPRYAMEPGDNELTYLRSRLERIEIMINGATLNLSTVCNADGSVTNTATITWGS